MHDEPTPPHGAAALSDEDPLHSPGLHGRLRYLPRNFRMGLEDHVRAAVGLPAWMRRTRDLERQLEDLERALELAWRHADPVRWRALAAQWDLSAVNEAILAFNEAFPIERDLPMDPSTRDFSHAGHPWKPLPCLDSAWILERLPAERAGRDRPGTDPTKQ